MQHSRHLALALALLAACVTEEDPPAPPPTTTSVAAVTTAVTQGFGAAVTIAAPIAQADMGADALVTESTYATDVGCVQMSWAGTTVTFVFTGCTLPVSGLPLDGTLVLGIRVAPLTVSVAMTALTLGETTFDGTASASLTNGGGTLRADLTSVRDGVTRTFDTDTDVTLANGVFTFDGTTTVDLPAFSASVDNTALRYAPPDCLPSGGSLTYYDDPSSTPVHIAFLATTPTTGEVVVTVGRLPPVSIYLPCL